MKKYILKSNKNSVIKPILIAFVFCLLLSVFTEKAMAQAPDTLWTRMFGGIGCDEGQSVQQTIDGGYIIVGYTSSFGAGGGDVYLIKTDTIGDTIWTKTFGGVSADYGQFVRQCTDGGYIVTGLTDTVGLGKSEVYLIRIASDEIGIVKNNKIKITKCKLYQNYPNPFNSLTSICYSIEKPSYISIKIYNQVGQTVRFLVNEKKNSGYYNVIWDGKDNRGKNVANGIYFYELRANKLVIAREMMYLK